MAQGVRRGLLTGAASAILATHLLAAQSPAETAALAAWNDSLQQVTRSEALADYDAPSRVGAGRAGDLRRALFQVRQADLTDSRGEIELVLTNMQVIANHTNGAWPRYIMAVAFEAMARKHWIETLSDGKHLAEKHADAAWRLLRSALDADPAFLPARRLFATLATAGGDRFLRRDQIGLLEREAQRPDADPDLLLTLGRHLRTLRLYDLALATFDRALARGGDASRLELERARTLFARRDASGAVAAYWQGIARLTPVGREMYHFDLAWIVDSTALAEFDLLPDSAVSPWLRRFWRARDAEAANNAGDRLREHLRRWVIVMEKYRALSPWKSAFFSRVELGFDYAPSDGVLLDYNNDSVKPSSCTRTDASMYEQLWRMQPSHAGDLRAREPLLDHRGLIYLRHGEPQRRIDGDGSAGGGFLGGAMVPPRRWAIVPAGQARGPDGVLLPWSATAFGEAPDRPNGPAGESWVYGIGGEWRVLQFRGSQALGTYAATTLTQRIPAAWLEDQEVQATLPGMTYVQLTRRIAREEASPLRKALRDTATCFREAIAASDQTDADEHFAIDRDTDTPPGLRPSSSVLQAFALGTADDQSGEVLVSFALAAEVLHLDRSAEGAPGYSIAFRAVAYDRRNDRVITIDTVRRFPRAASLAPGQFLAADLEFGLPAGSWQVAMRAQQLGGAVILNDSRAIRIDGTARISLSDVVTGRPNPATWMATDGSPFALNYTNGWHAGETAELFYEVRGVPADSSYRTLIEVRPVNPKARESIQLQSTDIGTGGVSYLRKTLGLTQLIPGKYRLIITVEYAGVRATREREILIVPTP